MFAHASFEFVSHIEDPIHDLVPNCIHESNPLPLRSFLTGKLIHPIARPAAQEHAALVPA
jgi:hypothetical protein